ncbi:Extracellular solute-binding protein [Pararobbsia alpina]|uniref:ABC transporter substrate-binding protein n=1 Tax=Pararobbsia alpina TaxID=621374 RepID=UPI0039A51D2A
MITLQGITWNHTRGFVPNVATAQRYHELNPDVQIQWQTRSLQAFADYSIADLAEKFDLLVIDHPSIGEAAKHGLFAPLDATLPRAFLDDQAANSVGSSHTSYHYDGHQWALACDAATPVASMRVDVLDRLGVPVPTTWDDVMELAKAGHVAVPAIPIDSLMNLYMFWLNEGETPCATPDRFGSDDVGERALTALRELVAACDPVCLTRNPIQTYEAMTRSDSIAYCPFAYGYSNYSRPGYATRRLSYGNLVTRHGERLRSTLGGAGVAVSAHSKHLDVAVDYARFMSEASIQKGIYVQSGGQPGHRQAWQDEEANRLANGYFLATLQTLDEAWQRPRYPGYIDFQNDAGHVVHAWLRGEADVRATLDALNRVHRQYASEVCA